MKFIPKRTLFRKLAALYERMGQAFDQAAPQGFTCSGCLQNCCVSHFQHHTYIEWLYLWEGLNALAPDKRDTVVQRARDHVDACRQALARGQVPSVLCPLNEDGACGLYAHRMMICRLYGVPNLLVSPRGVQRFPGCPRCMDLLASSPDAPVLDRTVLYRELAGLELDLLHARRGQLPRVDLTLAEMIVAGPPKV